MIKPESKTVFKLVFVSTSQLSSLSQPGHPVEVCQSGPEADERLLGGIYVH